LDDRRWASTRGTKVVDALEEVAIRARQIVPRAHQLDRFLRGFQVHQIVFIGILHACILEPLADSICNTRDVARASDECPFGRKTEASLRKGPADILSPEAGNEGHDTALRREERTHRRPA